MKERFNIIVIAEDVVDYAFVIARNCPKELRSDIIPSIRNYAIKILENITRANLTELDSIQRLQYQEEAKINLELLSSISYICKKNNYITFHQLDTLGDKLLKLSTSIDKWVESDKTRLNKNKA